MNIARRISRKISSVINSLTGGTAQNLNTGEVRGEAFPGIADAARRAACEGAVLLINDGTLPLSGEDRVALFGRVQTDWFYVGYGSGGDVRAPYLVSPVDGLRSRGVKLDEKLLSLYAAWAEKEPADQGFWGHWPHSHPEMPLSEQTARDAASRCDIAVVLIGRGAGEDRDSKPVKGSFYLTETEEKMLFTVRAAFKRTVVVMNTGSPMDMSWVKSLSPSALLMVWQGGMESGNALADILTGAAEPGGRLTDTIMVSREDHTAARDFGNKKFNFYREDVYVGYRGAETFAKDRVLFPFGSGQGYTVFAHTDANVRPKNGEVSVDVKVKNTGKRKGRETLGLYISAPCAPLPRPDRELAAFCKTDVIAPGDTADVTLSFRLEDIAAYDDVAHEWVTGKGEYVLYLGSNVREAKRIGSVTLERTLSKKTRSAAAPVIPFERLTRKGGAPCREPVPLSTTDLKGRIAGSIPDAVKKPSSNVTFEDVKSGNCTAEELAATLSLDELEAISRGDYVMNSPLGAKGNAGALGGVLPSLREKGIPAATTTDGPSGIRLAESCSLLPSGICIASSWDTALAQELYTIVGREMRAKGSHILLAPGLNIHRDPLCGRNFEYFSEDPLLAGKTAAAIIRGIQSCGVAACPKHFACNNQEFRRTRNDSRLSERALREIYLRPFMIAVREGSPHFIMTSYNKINGVWGHYNYDLCTTVLREEWGFEGAVMTDWWMRRSRSPEFPAIRDNAYRVRAGVDVLMPGGSRTGKRVPDGTLLESLRKDGGITLGELQRTAAHVIRALANMRVFD